MFSRGVHRIRRCGHTNLFLQAPEYMRFAAVLSRLSSDKAETVETIRKKNADVKPNPNFINRNPRNLERMCYAVKDFGWGMEWAGYARRNSSNLPRKNYYHRLILRNTDHHTYAEVQHSSGKIILTASTREWDIRRRLYNNTDAMAASNLGRIIASRCLRAGISCISFRHPVGIGEGSESIELFHQAAEEGGLILEEPDHIRLGHVKPHEKPLGPKPPELD